MSLLSDSEYEKFLAEKKYFNLISNKSFRWCPVPDCKGYAIKGNSNKLICNECSFAYCFKCSHAWHKYSFCNFEEVRYIQLYMNTYGLKLCPRCKIIIDVREVKCKRINCTKCRYRFCLHCGAEKCSLKRLGYQYTLFDICFEALLIPLLPFHTLIFVYTNLKYIKAGITGTKAMKNFATRYSKITYLLAFIIAILLIPFYFIFVLPLYNVSDATKGCFLSPFIVIYRRPKICATLAENCILCIFFGQYLFFIVSIVYIFQNIIYLLLFPYRICRLIYHEFYDLKPEYGIYGLKSRFRVPRCKSTRIIYLGLR